MQKGHAKFNENNIYFPHSLLLHKMGSILPTVREITPIIKKCIILESSWKCANGLLSNVEDVAKLQYVKKKTTFV
jgi:hypothetical protein